MRSAQFARILSHGLLEAGEGTIPGNPLRSTELIHPHDLSPIPTSVTALAKSRRCFPLSPALQPHIGGSKGSSRGWSPLELRVDR